MKLIYVIEDNGDGSSSAKYFRSNKDAENYMKWAWDNLEQPPEDIEHDIFTVENGVLCPLQGFHSPEDD